MRIQYKEAEHCNYRVIRAAQKGLNLALMHHTMQTSKPVYSLILKADGKLIFRAQKPVFIKHMLTFELNLFINDSDVSDDESGQFLLPN